MIGALRQAMSFERRFGAREDCAAEVEAKWGIVLDVLWRAFDG